MKHSEWAKTQNLSVPCAAWHITFDGRCLNCGYDPEAFTVEYPKSCELCGATLDGYHDARACELARS